MMSGAMSALEKVILPVAIKLGKQVHVNAIKNGFIRLMPLTLVGAMFVLINNVLLNFGEGSFFWSLGIHLDQETITRLDAFKVIGGSVYNGTLGIMSLLTPFFIGMALAEERKVDGLAAGLLSIAAFMTVTPYQIIMSMVSTPLASLGGIVGWAYVIFNSLLWFFGVHGGLALTALNSGILGPWGMENMAIYTEYGSVEAALAAGKTFHFWTGPMMESYVYLGGTGATLSLIFAIFIASRRADYRQVAKLALPSGLFNINEPILFGLPIIMNPVLMLPFVLIQPLLAGITLAAYSLGLIPPSTNFAPWTMPPGLGAFFNSNGSIAALILALVNLVLATLVYLPFVIIANKAQGVIAEEESETDIRAALQF